MKIAVIGRGNVGGGLADLWEGTGHEVTRIGRLTQYSKLEVGVKRVDERHPVEYRPRVEILTGVAPRKPPPLGEWRNRSCARDSS